MYKEQYHHPSMYKQQQHQSEQEHYHRSNSEHYRMEDHFFGEEVLNHRSYSENVNHLTDMDASEHLK